MEELKFLERLSEVFKKLPGVGSKTAMRYAYYVVEKYTKEDIERICNVLTETIDKVHKCPICGMLTTNDICEICSNPLRDKTQILVVKVPKDLLSIEKTNQYNGLYHVLGGLISAFEGITPDKLNIESLDKYFESKVSLYDYSYSHEYIRNRVGTNFFDSKEMMAITIKNHLIEVHKKYVEKQSDYIASAHSIIEDLYKEMLKTILSKSNVNYDFELNKYFNSGKDFEEYIEMLGFDIKIDQQLFQTEVNKALAVDFKKTEIFIKQGIINGFEKSTNRIKMQTLILLLKLNNNLANDFLINQYDLKNLFKLTTIVMYLDRSHQQNNNYNESQATYIVNELLDLVKNAYNNKKVINWRN